MLSLQKNYFSSLFSSPDFLFEISVISIAEPFLRGRGGQVKQTETNKGGGGSKTGSFERKYFLNDPL